MPQGANRLTFATAAIDGVHLLAVFGDIDPLVQPEFQEALDKAVEESNSPLVIDLSGVGTVSALGFGALVPTQRKMTARPDKLYIVVNSPRMSKSLSVLGLSKFFDLYSSTEDAVQAAARDMP